MHPGQRPDSLAQATHNEVNPPDRMRCDSLEATIGIGAASVRFDDLPIEEKIARLNARLRSVESACPAFARRIDHTEHRLACHRHLESGSVVIPIGNAGG